ncbi:MAG: hypothetical protein AB7E47_15380 [Desulfovibrionaceae bacterium]
MAAVLQTAHTHAPDADRRPLPPARLAALFLAAVLFAPVLPALAAEDGAAGAAQDGQTALRTAPPEQAAPQPRDNVFGTLHEGMVMERDPDTGDQIIQIRSRPKATSQGNGVEGDQPLVITPRISPRIKVK